MATKKPVFTNPLNYLGIPAGKSPSKPAPKAAVNPTYIPVSDPRYQREADLKEQALVNAKEKALADAAANKSTSTSSQSGQIESKGSIAEDKARADAAVAAAKAAQQQSMQAIQDTPEYKALVRTFTAYGMSDFADIYLQIKADNPKADKDTIESLLKTDPKYNTDAQGNAKGYAKRFAGNVALVKQGKIPLTEDAYLQAEAGYEKAFKGYDLGAMANQKAYADLIASDVSADEATSRIQLGYDKLKNNPQVLNAFRKFYPTLSDGDIVSGILNSKEQLVTLERKVAAAEVGGAALRQNLTTSEARAEELRGLGVTQAKAETGYKEIAGYADTATKLSQIERGNVAIQTPEIMQAMDDKLRKETQTTAEESQLLGLASAKRKEEQLAEREINRFSMQVGASRGAFSRNTTF